LPKANRPSEYNTPPEPVIVLPLIAAVLEVIVPLMVRLPVFVLTADNEPTLRLLMYGVPQDV
jgi:hypothetical protein